MIDFHSHVVRHGKAGARDEFETMLGQLLGAIIDDVRVVHATSGDWGIDVLSGSLVDSVRLWQAKFHIDGFGESQKSQVRASFTRAVAVAREQGHTIKEWTLCVPVNFDVDTLKWWEGWRTRNTEETGVPIALLDATQLSAHLLRPEADHVRRAYYDPYREPDKPIAASTVVHRAPSTAPGWTAGQIVTIGQNRYLLHAGLTETWDVTGQWLWRQGRANRVDPYGPAVWLRQLDSPGATRAVTTLRDALRTQAESAGAATTAAPLLVTDGSRTTLIHEHAPGIAWREFFDDNGMDPDPWSTARILEGAAELGEALSRWHELGAIHGDIGPDTVRVLTDTGRTVFRDHGNARLPNQYWRRTEQYPIPELSRSSRHSPGPWTDVRLLAALVHHTIAGWRPSAANPPPIRTAMREFGIRADDLIRRALRADPRERPPLPELIDGFEAEARRLQQEHDG